MSSPQQLGLRLPLPTLKCASVIFKAQSSLYLHVFTCIVM